MTRAPTLAELVAAVERRYPPRWAVDGDAIGLVTGDPEDTVERVLYAVDPVRDVVDEAIRSGAQALVVHHPLLYRPVSRVATDEPKGRVIHDLIRHGVGLYVAHTNADTPAYGVSESMAVALGLTNLRPLVADPVDPLDKIVVFVPHDDAQKLIDARPSSPRARGRSVRGLARTRRSVPSARSRSWPRAASRWCCAGTAESL